jgi:hypothetical protein
VGEDGIEPPTSSLTMKEILRQRKAGGAYEIEIVDYY